MILTNSFSFLGTSLHLSKKVFSSGTQWLGPRIPVNYKSFVKFKILPALLKYDWDMAWRAHVSIFQLIFLIYSRHTCTDIDTRKRNRFTFVWVFKLGLSYVYVWSDFWDFGSETKTKHRHNWHAVVILKQTHIYNAHEIQYI